MDKTSKPVRLPDITAKIYDLLEPLDALTRSKVLQAALALLGEHTVLEASPVPPGAALPTGGASVASSRHVSGPKAQAWIRKHGLTDAQLEQVFHFDNDQVEMIAIPPGETNREKTINAYILIGAQHLLLQDEAKFTEGNAVAACKNLGCHDSANHAQTRSKFGNKISGSKDGGYVLTVPGLDQAAALIKELTASKGG